jgi:hypothetical protein
LEVTEKVRIFADVIELLKLTFMESTVKKRTREEVRAAFKEAMRKKKEWIEESNVFLEQIHKKRLAGLI